MADEAAVVEKGISPVQSPLVEVSFQKNVNRKQKYLEAEPKALGITQIGMSLFNITCSTVFVAKGLSHQETEIPVFVSSLLVAIAGSVAIGAENLHLPVLRACLGMQIVACGASIVNMVCTLVKVNDMPYYCWHYNYGNNTLHTRKTCLRIEEIRTQLYAACAVIQALLFAISVTLAAYCCKVVNCCSPTPKMPVITVQPPSVQQ
ncbi:uncharacterized protein LOC113157536 [Anabas testudineus]|uniref:Membrane-spanning 4-domains subfamily A member 4A-like n=1 Tax=Anabas testudineus TaxID=64144 RepID=A0A3Q1H4H2_ANATE|nr:uncharacterized protein LOC113157536 [Anabas testudineus]